MDDVHAEPLSGVPSTSFPCLQAATPSEPSDPTFVTESAPLSTTLPTDGGGDLATLPKSAAVPPTASTLKAQALKGWDQPSRPPPAKKQQQQPAAAPPAAEASSSSDQPPQSAFTDDADVEDVLRSLASKVSAMQRAFHKQDKSTKAINENAHESIEKCFQTSSVTWADPLRLLIRKEVRKLINASEETYESAVDLESAAKEFEAAAFEVPQLLHERMLIESANIRRALKEEEEAHAADVKRLEAERVAEVEPLRAEVVRLKVELAATQKYGAVIAPVICAAFAPDVEELERQVGTVRAEMEAILYRKIEEHAKEAFRRRVANQFTQAAKEAELAETQKILSQLNTQLESEKAEKQQQARTLKEGTAMLRDQLIAKQKENERLMHRIENYAAEAEGRKMAALREQELRMQAEADLLSAEIMRLRGAISSALKPTPPPPPEAVADGRAFLLARQKMFYESLKAPLGEDPKDAARLPKAGPSSLSWRGHKTKLEVVRDLNPQRMSFKNDASKDGTFGPAPPLRPPNLRPPSAQRDDSPRVRRQQQQQQVRPSSAAPAARPAGPGVSGVYVSVSSPRDQRILTAMP